jgi:hypothetical protein
VKRGENISWRREERTSASEERREHQLVKRGDNISWLVKGGEIISW